MDLLLPDSGLVEIWLRVADGTIVYRLFSNNVTQGLSAVPANFSEVTALGYAPVNRVRADFTLTGVTAHNGFVISPPISFTQTSGGDQNVYGYYVTDTGKTVVFAFALFDAPPFIMHSGVPLNVLPNLGDFSQLSS